MRRSARVFRFLRAEDGTAAIEMALVGGLLVGALLNVAEIGRYAWMATEVSAASQAGAQAALTNCDPTKTPITVNCPNVTSLITTTIQGSSLGSKITLKGSPEEGWYCMTPTHALEQVAPATAAKPTNCASVGNAGAEPALYVKITVTSAYEAMFPGLTLAEQLPATIQRSAWMRVL